MCSPDEGPRRTETLHFIIKSLELKCHVYIFNYYLCYYIPTHGAHIDSFLCIIYIYNVYSLRITHNNRHSRHKPITESRRAKFNFRVIQ